MKKILICASRMSHILNFHLPYAAYFRQKGYAVDIAAEGAAEYAASDLTGNSKAAEYFDNCYDFRFVKNPLSPQNLKTVSKLKHLLKENDYEIAYSNSTLAGAALRMAVKRLGKKRPYCVHISHGYMFDSGGSMRSRIYRTAEKLSSGVTDALIVMNEEDLALAEKYRLGKKIFFINGMGLCTERFPEISDKERQMFRQDLGADEDTIILLCVGEFSGRKNQALLIKAYDKLRSLRRNTLLVFGGSGAELEVCRELAEKYELTPYVRFLGQVQDVNTLYRSGDILLSGAKMEGLPFNVMEAIYCGVPVIASDIKGHRDLITDGENGLLFDVNSPNAETLLAERLQTVLQDQQLFAYLKKNAFLDKRFTIDYVKPQVLRVLDREFEENETTLTEVINT